MILYHQVIDLSFTQFCLPPIASPIYIGVCNRIEAIISNCKQHVTATVRLNNGEAELLDIEDKKQLVLYPCVDVISPGSCHGEVITAVHVTIQ